MIQLILSGTLDIHTSTKFPTSEVLWMYSAVHYFSFLSFFLFKFIKIIIIFFFFL